MAKQSVALVLLVAVVGEVGLDIVLLVQPLSMVAVSTLAVHSVVVVAAAVAVVLDIVAMPSLDHIADVSWIKTTHLVSVVLFVVVNLKRPPQQSHGTLPHILCWHCHDHRHH